MDFAHFFHCHFFVIIQLGNLTMMNRHRMRPSRNLHQGRSHHPATTVLLLRRREPSSIFRKILHAQRRRHHDQLQRRHPPLGFLRRLPPQRQRRAEQPQQYVGVQIPFVRLVDDDGAVLSQEQVRLDFLEQYTVRHEFQTGVVLRAETGSFVTSLIRHQIVGGDGGSVSVTHFVSDAFGGGYGGHASRLGDANEQMITAAPATATATIISSANPAAAAAARGKSRLVQKLRNLGGLPAPRLPAEHGAIVVAHGVDDLVLHGRYGEIVP
mmetsp:Transcript_37937/g.64811  ORF Transcript_37937/g.64811 Transcript_37937/m.64811 type:complete len:268 (-) Transcript_37937:1091-1894(-)